MAEHLDCNQKVTSSILAAGCRVVTLEYQCARTSLIALAPSGEARTGHTLQHSEAACGAGAERRSHPQPQEAPQACDPNILQHRIIISLYLESNDYIYRDLKGEAPPPLNLELGHS